MNLEFHAPWSRSLQWSTALSIAVLATVALAGGWMATSNMVRALFLVIPATIIARSLYCGVRGYELTDQEIRIRRWGSTVYLPLRGLRAVEGDAEAMKNAIRVFANGGVFAFTGWYWSPALKWFRAYATDPARAVVLHYEHKKTKIVITPHDPQAFILRARTLLQTCEFFNPNPPRR